MIPAAGIGLAAVAAVAAIAAVFFRKLGLRVVGARPRRKPIVAAGVGSAVVQLEASPEAVAAGSHALRFGANFSEHGILGPVQTNSNGSVTRSIHGLSQPLPPGSWPAVITGYPPMETHPLAGRITNVVVPGPDGAQLPAWYIPGPSSHWTIHVQGIRTSREVTLRSMDRTVAAGLPTLSVTYRGAGESSEVDRSTLGQREWKDLLASVEFARERGAGRVTVVGWSMGAGVALELARRVPSAVDNLILIAPATDWPQVIRHGAARAHLPQWVGGAAVRFIGSRLGAQLLGLPERLEVDRLKWSGHGDLSVPALVIHSRGDQEIPYAISEAFAAAHPELVTLVEFPATPHAWEANADPDLFAQVFASFLGSSQRQN